MTAAPVKRMRLAAVQRRGAAQRRHASARLFRWAFAVRVATGLLAYWLTFYADVPLVVDAQYYDWVGHKVASVWLSGGPIDLESVPESARSARLLIILIGGFYVLTAGIRALPVLLVLYSLITALVPVYAYLIARELGVPELAARRAGWLVALSPAFLIHSGVLYKEGLVLLCLAVATYHTLLLQSGWRTRSAVSVLISLLGLWGIRYYLAILMIGAVGVSLGWRRRPSLRGFGGLLRSTQRTVVIAGFTALVIGLSIFEGTERILVEDGTGLLVELDKHRAGSAAEARSGYLQDARIDTPGAALRYLPVGLLYFLTVPFPWDLGPIRQNLVIPENAFWLMLYPLVVVGIMRGLRVNTPGTMFLLFVTSGMCVVYALLVGNVGTAYRMRIQIWLLWAPFAAWGWVVWHERIRQRRLGRLAARLTVRRQRFTAAKAR